LLKGLGIPVGTPGTRQHKENYSAACPAAAEPIRTFLALIDRATDGDDWQVRRAELRRLTDGCHDFEWRERLFDGLETLIGILGRPVPVDDEPHPSMEMMKPADGHVVKPWSIILASWQCINPGKDVTNNKRKLDRFLGWLKANGHPHDDAAAVTKAIMIDYRDALVTNRKTPDNPKGTEDKTIDNHLTGLRALFSAAVDDEKLSVNPMKGVKFNYDDTPKGEIKTLRKAETRLILAECGTPVGKIKDMAAWVKRDEPDPFVKWGNMLAAYHGFRIAEIAEAHTDDVFQMETEQFGPMWVLAVREDNREPGQTVKTDTSVRRVPLHSAVLHPGFIAYVKSVPRGPLFPHIPLDSKGKRAHNASREINIWLRHIGIPPERSFHGHRHAVEDHFRNLAEGDIVRDDISDRILGHSNKKNVSRRYGGFAIAAMKVAIERISFAEGEMVEAAD
jgi:integrase